MLKGQINKKLYYSISEVSEITGLEQHVIRYWESEFPKLKPKKNRAGNRQFREKDIQIIRYIKHLLQNDMYTVQGAKKKLNESGYKEVEGQLDLLNVLPAKRNPGIVQLRTPEPQKDEFSEEVSKEDSAKVSSTMQDIKLRFKGDPKKFKALITDLKSELSSIKSLLSEK